MTANGGYSALQEDSREAHSTAHRHVGGEKQAEPPPQQHQGEKALQRRGSVPEMASEMFEKMQSEHLPTFLAHLSIDPDGGLDKIADLWDPLKYLWFAMFMAAILINSFMLTHANWTVFEGFFYTYLAEMEETAAHLSQGKLDAKDMDVVSVAKGGGDASAVREAQGGVDIFVYVAHQVRSELLGIATVVASFEVLMIFYYICLSIGLLWRFARAKDPFNAYLAIVQLSQSVVPIVGTFSAVKMMALVHPSLIYAQYLDYVQESPLTATSKLLVNLLFAVTRIFALVFAIFAFAIKLLAVAIKLSHPLGSWYLSWLYVMALLNQCMGVVLIDQVLQERIFLFVFGGSDADFQDEERALKQVYMARVAQQIWENFWKKQRRFQAIVMLVTFDHYDMQKLLVEEDEAEKAGNTGTVLDPARSPREMSPRSASVAVAVEDDNNQPKDQ